MSTEKTILVLIYAPGAYHGVNVRVESDLENFQRIVCGLITCAPSGREGVDVIANDEGIIDCMPKNRFIADLEQWICGPMIIARADEQGEYVDLSDDDRRWARGQFDIEAGR